MFCSILWGRTGASRRLSYHWCRVESCAMAKTVTNLGELLLVAAQETPNRVCVEVETKGCAFGQARNFKVLFDWLLFNDRKNGCCFFFLAKGFRVHRQVHPHIYPHVRSPDRPRPWGCSLGHVCPNSYSQCTGVQGAGWKACPCSSGS